MGVTGRAGMTDEIGETERAAMKEYIGNDGIFEIPRKTGSREFEKISAITIARYHAIIEL